MKLTSCAAPRWANAEHSAIDCLVTFEELGAEVLPFTASPDDKEKHGRDVFARALAGNFGTVSEFVAPQQSQEQTIKALAAAVQRRLDAFAKSLGYDGILSACTYAGDPHPKFAAEGRRALAFRSSTWRVAHALFDDVTAGRRAAPKTLSEIEAELPSPPQA